MSARSAAQSEGSRDPENGASGYQVSTCEPRGRTQRSHHAHYEPIERILVCQQTKFNQYSPAYPVVQKILAQIIGMIVQHKSFSQTSRSINSTLTNLQQLKQLQLHFLPLIGSIPPNTDLSSLIAHIFHNHTNIYSNSKQQSIIYNKSSNPRQVALILSKYHLSKHFLQKGRQNSRISSYLGL